MRSTTLGKVTLARTLPANEFDFVNERIAARTRDGTSTDARFVSAWGGFASGWNAVAHRQHEARTHAQAFHRSMAKPETVARRASQDSHLFAFFNSASSCLETFHFAMNCVGAVAWPRDFALDKKGLKAFPVDVRERLKKVIPGSALLVAMEKTANDPALVFIHDMRRVLFHRGSPPREWQISSDPARARPSSIPTNLHDAAEAWKFGFQLAPNCLAPSLDALDRTVRELVLGAADFAKTHLK